MYRKLISVFTFIVSTTLLASHGNDALADFAPSRMSNNIQKPVSPLPCVYEIANSWGSGFTGVVHITNTRSTTINGWEVSWHYQKNTISSIWNAKLSGAYTASDVGWNGTIQPGQSVTFGFQGKTNGASVEEPVLTGDICDTTHSSASSSSSVSSAVSSAISSTSSETQCTEMCQWYQDSPRPLCLHSTTGWGWENNQSCIGRTTCESQSGNGGVVQICPNSSSSSRSSASVSSISSESSNSSVISNSSQVSSSSVISSSSQVSSSSISSGFPLPITINEVVASNDGVAIDEKGETEDWLEIINRSNQAVELNQFAIADSNSDFVTLPERTLAAGETLLFWADDDTDDGERHLPFKLSASGDALILKRLSDQQTEELTTPELETNIAYARFPDGEGEWHQCRYASPGRQNGSTCESDSKPSVDDGIVFEEFPIANWPVISPQTLGINELAIRPADFVEIKNFSDQAINLGNYRLTLAAYPPTSGLPAFDTASYIDLPAENLGAGEYTAIAVPASLTQAIEDQAYNEGIAVLFDKRNQQMIDRVPFMHWPSGNVLSRSEDAPYRFRFCTNKTASMANVCDILASREIGDRTRGIYTPHDFAALAEGESKTTVESVKFIIDLHKDNAVHFPGARRWPLHYTFVRELIDLDPPLDRCDSLENQEFYQGWATFSYDNYFDTVNRRYHLGTISKHPNAGLNNVEFTFGDEITAQQMRDAFYWITAFLPNPFEWTLRPQDDEQVVRVRAIEGTLPMVSPKAPFKDIVYQGLAPGVAYGTLTFVATDQLADVSLGNRVIVITNDVPNDIDFVGGLITEAFQTPLAHVNILSQSRNTPNMALPGASTQPEIAALLGTLVKLEVTPGGYSLQPASLSEAQAFWDQQTQHKDPLIPRLDALTEGLVDLQNADFSSLPAIGAKAAQMAELYRMDQDYNVCPEGANFSMPESAFAIPVRYYLQHMQASGAQDYLDELLQDELFLTDLGYRKIALQTLQQKITQHPVDSALLAEVTDWVDTRFGSKRVRFRSSSNTEDLQSFNGAGLYTSVSAELGDEERPVAAAMQTVWASLWNIRAFEERLYANVDQTKVAMGILVHRAFTNERANGVAVTRNILVPTRVDQYYINSQAGEASVTNPAPGVITEQLIYQWPPRTPTLTYHSYSNLLEDTRVITDSEVRALACAMDTIDRHFRAILDPDLQDRWFTMESEFKLLGKKRELLIKQARPYQIGDLDIPNDCREDI